MTRVARTGMSIDVYNQNVFEEGIDTVLPYKIVQFIVPEEAAAQNTNFFSSDLWGTLGDGRENGFLPIFYISRKDWENTFNEESRLNSTFIRQLKYTLSSGSPNVYWMDEKRFSIQQASL